jgi:uncharacterized protein YkwD
VENTAFAKRKLNITNKEVIMRITIISIAAILLCLMCTISFAAQPLLWPVEQEVFDKVNAERARYGLVALEIDKDLLDTAREHCWHMTIQQSMHHGSYRVAENIAMGQSNSDHVMRSWLNSSGHRANILNPNHRKIGIAAYINTSSRRIFWCQQFR